MTIGYLCEERNIIYSSNNIQKNSKLMKELTENKNHKKENIW